MMTNDSHCRIVKVCTLGCTKVGKTSIVLKYVNDTFDPNQRPTLGASFLSRMITAPGGNLYKLQIWDTAGEERFKSLTPMYYRGATVVLIVYDIANNASFTKGVREWVEELQTKGPSDALLVLIGNKLDLASEKREVLQTDAKDFADSIGAMFFESSAKTGENIEKIFSNIGNCLETHISERLQDDLPCVPQIGRKAELSWSWRQGRGKNDWTKQATVKLHKNDNSNENATTATKCCSS